VFAHAANRKVLQADGSRKEYVSYNFGAQLWLSLNPGKTIEDLPAHMVTADDLKVMDHIRIQEACQMWTDASISKTINLPTEATYEEFVDVYRIAYESGLKGCTTYRPSDVRGSVLSKIGDTPATQEEAKAEIAIGAILQALQAKRPDILDSKTAKLRWPQAQSALYLTVGYLEDETPFEVFLNSKDQSNMEWMTVSTLLLSWLLRAGIPMETLGKELKQVHSLEGGWVNGEYFPSLVSYLGEVLMHLDKQASIIVPKVATSTVATPAVQPKGRPSHQCHHCNSYNVRNESGCFTCNDCGWSKCG
jgi:ribonucleoside-diphosphate reductase alpha chain